VKSAGSIRHKISQIRYRHLKKRLETELRQVPGNCVYNAVIPPPTLPTGQTPNGVPVGVPLSGGEGFGICMFGAGDIAKWKPTFCDEQVDGGTRAKKCSDFCPRRSKEQVKDDFAQELQRMTLAEVAYNYPDLAALIWVLDESDLPPLGTEESVEAPASEPTPPPPPTQQVPVVAPPGPVAVEAEVLPLEPATGFLPAAVEPKTTWWSRLLGGVWP